MKLIPSPVVFFFTNECKLMTIPEKSKLKFFNMNSGAAEACSFQHPADGGHHRRRAANKHLRLPSVLLQQAVEFGLVQTGADNIAAVVFVAAA